MKLSWIGKSFTALLLLSFPSSPAKAAVVSISENQPLSFGTFAMGTFSSVITINIRNNGTFTTAGSVSLLVNPTRGEYTLDATPASAGVVYTITTPPSIVLTGPGSTFNVDNIRVRPNSLQFNGAGIDNIRIAARLRSLGDGNAFNGGTYTNNLTLNVAF